MKDIRLRPREFAEVRAGDLMAHPLNPRTHPETQLEALQGSLEQFGDVRSLLAYRSAKWGKVVLLDGHARQSLDSERPVMVEILTDVTDEEAEALLLTIDPLAALAGYDEERLEKLRSVRRADNDTLHALHASLRANDEAVQSTLKKAGRKQQQADEDSEACKVIVHCDTEKEANALFKRFKREGLVVELKKV